MLVYVLMLGGDHFSRPWNQGERDGGYLQYGIYQQSMGLEHVPSGAVPTDVAASCLGVLFGEPARSVG